MSTMSAQPPAIMMAAISPTRVRPGGRPSITASGSKSLLWCHLGALSGVLELTAAA
jgi:hypothetical protein